MTTNTTRSVHLLAGTSADSLDDAAACGRRRGDMVGSQYSDDPAEVTCKACLK